MTNDTSTAHDKLQGLLWSAATHRVITVAGKTGVLGALSQGKVKTAGEIAATCSLFEPATEKLLRALAALGIAVMRDNGYALDAGMAALFQPGEADMTWFLEHAHSMYENWGANLESWVRDDDWKHTQRDDQWAHRFAKAMQGMGTHVAQMAADIVDLSRVKRMLDVGGGVGHFAQAFCERQPDLSAVVLDTEVVAALGRERIENTAMKKRIQFVGGDYHSTDVTGSFDLVLLANVIHQELEAGCSNLIDRAVGAVSAGGRVVVLDFAIGEAQQDYVVGALFAINMRSFGDTYKESTIRDWMTEAGLENIERRDVGAHRWMIIGEKQ